MNYVEEHLQPGEQVVYRARLHRIMFVVPAIFAFVGVLCGIGAIAGDAGATGLIFFVIFSLPFLLVFLAYTSAEFAVTNQRVIIKVGVVRRRSLEMLLTKIEGVGVNQGLLGRMLDYGTILVTGTGGTREQFTNIAAPMEFRKHVQAQVQASQAAGVAPPTGFSMTGPPMGARVPAAVGPREERECPHCAELILVKAKTCKHCGRDV